MTEEDKYFISLGMKTFGGGFMQCIGMALSHADAKNANILRMAFPNDFKRYHTLGMELHKEQSMKPKEKNPKIDDAIEQFTGLNRKAVIEHEKCAFCDDPDLDFKDDLSKKEYEISGICQKCQDEIFDQL